MASSSITRCKLLQGQHGSSMATSCAWLNGAGENNLVTSGDDETLKRVHADDLTAETLLGSTQGFVTDMSFSSAKNGGKGALGALALSDGTLRLVNAATGREEKKVDAYKSCAAISVCWSHDGTALASGGEDGTVKVWSRAGMLRNTVAATRFPVYALCWGRREELLFASGRSLIVEQRERKQMLWKAHEGTVLCVDWNPVTNLVVSGGEDCKYRVWDAFGRQLFQSKPMDHVVTSVSWAASGACFAVGSFNVVKVCDKTGWTHAREALSDAGSVLGLEWSRDGTLLGGACASGAALVAEVAGPTLEWKHAQVSMRDARQLEVLNTVDDTSETLVFRDRIVNLSLAFGHLVVHCGAQSGAKGASQVHVHSLANLTSPVIIDVPAGAGAGAGGKSASAAAASVLVQGDKSFLAAWSVFSYEGRRVCAAPQVFNGIDVSSLSPRTVALNDHLIAVLEDSRTAVRLVDQAKKQVAATVQHKAEIVQLLLCKHERDTLVFLDANGDVHLHRHSGSGPSRTFKLPCAMAVSIALHHASDALVACTDGGAKLVTWFFPQVAWVDPDLLADTSTEVDTPRMAAAQPEILSYIDNLVSVRLQDGAVVASAVSRYPALLHKLVVEQRKWEDALRLCRFVGQRFMWATLAAMALNLTHLDTAEIALAAIDHVAKLQFVTYIKGISSEKARMAQLALYKRDPKAAEQILLSANPPLLYEAVKLNVRLFQWRRAEQLAAGDDELAKMVHLYQTQAQNQRLLPVEDLKALKAIKRRYRTKNDNDDDESDDDDDDGEASAGDDNPAAPTPVSEEKD